jgi:hypothetical protein
MPQKVFKITKFLNLLLLSAAFLDALESLNANSKYCFIPAGLTVLVQKFKSYLYQILEHLV